MATAEQEREKAADSQSQKAIAVRQIEVPPWAREAQRRIIAEALARKAQQTKR